MLDRHNTKRYHYFMEIRVLKYFLAVAKEGNITKAANTITPLNIFLNFNCPPILISLIIYLAK